jgi:inorganic phosphate transporter, PiT family
VTVDLLLQTALILAALAFVFLNGVNDGGALVSVGLRMAVFRPWQAILLLAAATSLVPLLLGTAVATTLATRLVAFSGTDGQLALLAALLGAAATVFLLTRMGTPTSLTLAIVGGITGAGLGAGLPVAGAAVLTVLVIAAVAPLAGGLLAFAVSRSIALLPPARQSAARSFRRAHVLSFSSICCAYGANDGQKMLAVYAVAAAAGGEITVVTPGWRQLSVIGVLFVAGAVVGVRRLASRVGSAILAVRPMHAVAAEFSAATAVLGTATIGAPVSMTQAIVGGLVGTGASDGVRRVRWPAASSVLAAWVATLPLALVIAAALSTLGRIARP